MKQVLIILLVVHGLQAMSQKKVLIEDEDQIIQTAKTAIDNALQAPEGVLYLWSKEIGIKGSYVLDISIKEKGVVASIFVADKDENASISFQNQLKDRIFQFEFDFKMPKGKIYKFQYSFNFN